MVQHIDSWLKSTPSWAFVTVTTSSATTFRFFSGCLECRHSSHAFSNSTRHSVVSLPLSALPARAAPPIAPPHPASPVPAPSPPLLLLLPAASLLARRRSTRALLTVFPKKRNAPLDAPSFSSPALLHPLSMPAGPLPAPPRLFECALADAGGSTAAPSETLRLAATV